MFDAFQRLIEQIQGAIFETAIQPLLFRLGMMDWAEDVFDGVEFALYGAVAVVLAYLLFRPLELWRPVERWGGNRNDRRPVRTDVIFTLVHRVGVVPAILFVVLAPIGVMIDSHLRF